jgi:tetratricopeptide (TPR) repeat protein
MWWIFAFVLAVALFLFWPTKTRCFLVELTQAGCAVSARDWNLFAQHSARAREAATRLKPGPAAHFYTADLDFLCGQAAYLQGRFDEAVPLLEHAIEGYERSNDCQKAIRISVVRNQLGDLRYDQSNLVEAEREFRRAAQTISYGLDPAMSIFSLQRLADVLLEQQRFDDAREIVHQCMEFERKLLTEALAKEGKSLSECIVKSMSAPDLALANRDFVQAEQLFQEKVNHWNGMAAKPDNIDVTRYQFHLATAQRELGRIGESLETLRRACQTAERDFGLHHPRVARARQRLERAEQSAAGAQAT